MQIELGIYNPRPEVFSLLHNAGVLEVLYQVCLALDPTIPQLADLSRLELIPLLLVELLVE